MLTRTVYGPVHGAVRRGRRIPSRRMRIHGNRQLSWLSMTASYTLTVPLLIHRDSIRSNKDETAEYLVTGSVDDAVKVWELKNGTLKMKHKLTGHSLGVVSVAVCSDGSSKLMELWVEIHRDSRRDTILSFYVPYVCRMCLQLSRFEPKIVGLAIRRQIGEHRGWSGWYLDRGLLTGRQVRRIWQSRWENTPLRHRERKAGTDVGYQRWKVHVERCLCTWNR